MPLIAALLLLILAPPLSSQPRFTDQTAAAGIDFFHTFGGEHKHYILEAHGSGAAFFDRDNDGDLDLYIVNGATFDTYRQRSGPGNVLYANRGDGTFQDVTSQTGTADAGWGAGAAVGDIDSDGWRDLYVTNYGANVLYANQGDGTFQDITSQTGTAGDAYSASAAFFDYDNDGDLDLYVTNYVQFALDDMPDEATQAETCVFFGGVRVYCGPKGMPGAADVLYRNDDGVFTDVTDASGVGAANRYYGLGVVPADFDLDGDTDLFVANDETPNVLFDNGGDGTFTDIALFAGVAYNAAGDEEAGMGVDAGDYDNDGDYDLYVTHFFRETNTLYRNDGPARFADATVTSGLAAPTVTPLGWGTRFFDADNDGWLDLFVANGHVYPQVERVDSGSPYRQADQFFLNLGDGNFAEHPTSVPGPPKVSRGASFGDYDNDGDTDIYVAALNDRPTLLRNDSAPKRRWLTLQLVGTRANTDGLGARVRLQAGGRTQWRQVNGAASYLSHSDTRLHFGLGTATRVERLDITWPGGQVQTVKDLPADRLVVVPQEGPHRVMGLEENPYAD